MAPRFFLCMQHYIYTAACALGKCMQGHRIICMKVSILIPYMSLLEIHVCLHLSQSPSCLLSCTPSIPPSLSSSLSLFLDPSLPPSFPPSSLPRSLSSSIPPSLPPSLSSSLPLFLDPSLPPSIQVTTSSWTPGEKRCVLLTLVWLLIWPPTPHFRGSSRA